jgi:hypothetical protein
MSTEKRLFPPLFFVLHRVGGRPGPVDWRFLVEVAGDP